MIEILQDLPRHPLFAQAIARDFPKLIAAQLKIQGLLVKRTGETPFTECMTNINEHFFQRVEQQDRHAKEFTLEDLISLQEAYQPAGLLDKDSLHQHNYEMLEMPPADVDDFSARCHWQAKQILTTLQGRLAAKQPCEVFLSLLGNNSLEASISSTQLFFSLLENAYLADPTGALLTQLLDRTHFIITSAGGKATDANVVEGRVINLKGNERCVDAKSKLVLSGDYTFSSDDNYDLKQFGCNAIKVKILGKFATVTNPATNKIIYHNIPVRCLNFDGKSPSLLFGKTEAQRNLFLVNRILKTYLGDASKPSAVKTALQAAMSDKNFRLFEDETTNTGENILAMYQLVETYCNQHNLSPSDCIIMQTQKLQQSLRAMTSTLAQFKSPACEKEPTFLMIGYINWQINHLQLLNMSKGQFAIWYLCLLKEFVASEWYLVSRKEFHLPASYHEESIVALTRHVAFLHQISQESPADNYDHLLEELSSQEPAFPLDLKLHDLHNWFSREVWMSVERTLVRGPEFPLVNSVARDNHRRLLNNALKKNSDEDKASTCSNYDFIHKAAIGMRY